MRSTRKCRHAGPGKHPRRGARYCQRQWNPVEAGFGVTDRERNFPITPDTFSACNPAQGFTATAILLAVQEGCWSWIALLPNIYPASTCKPLRTHPEQLITYATCFHTKPGSPMKRRWAATILLRMRISPLKSISRASARPGCASRWASATHIPTWALIWQAISCRKYPA